MRKQENEGFLGDLAANNRIGSYKPAWSNGRLIGPDIHILISSFLLILIPSVWFIFNQVLLYGNIFLIGLVELVFIASMCIDLYTLVDVGTSDSGIIPKSTHKVNMKYSYYIDPKKTGCDLIKLKVCKTCNIVRPPRSFHCKKCDSCIEVHDHHCPWTGTCIGRRTHKKFIIFLYATCMHGVVSTILSIYPLYVNYDKPITNMMKLSSIILLAYSIIIALLMFFFGMFHLIMARKNITTNEKLRGAYKRKTNPFDVGTERNWYVLHFVIVELGLKILSHLLLVF